MEISRKFEFIKLMKLASPFLNNVPVLLENGIANML